MVAAREGRVEAGRGRGFFLPKMLTIKWEGAAALRKVARWIIARGAGQMPRWRDEASNDEIERRWSEALPVRGEGAADWLCRFATIAGAALGEGLDEPQKAFDAPAKPLWRAFAMAPLAGMAARFYATSERRSGRVLRDGTWGASCEPERESAWTRYSTFDLLGRASLRRQWGAACSRPFAPHWSGARVRLIFGGVAGAMLGAVAGLALFAPKALGSWAATCWRCALWERRSRAAMLRDRRSAIESLRAIPEMAGARLAAWETAWGISGMSDASDGSVSTVGYQCGPELGFVPLGSEVSSSLALCCIAVSWLPPRQRTAAAACLFAGSAAARAAGWAGGHWRGVEPFFQWSHSTSSSGLSAANLDPVSFFVDMRCWEEASGNLARQALMSLVNSAHDRIITGAAAGQEALAVSAVARCLWPTGDCLAQMAESAHISWAFAAWRALGHPLSDDLDRHKKVVSTIIRRDSWEGSMELALRSTLMIPAGKEIQLAAMGAIAGSQQWRRAELGRMICAEIERRELAMAPPPEGGCALAAPRKARRL